MTYHGGHTEPALGTLERKLGYVLSGVDKMPTSVPTLERAGDLAREIRGDLWATMRTRYANATQAEVVTAARIERKIGELLERVDALTR